MLAVIDHSVAGGEVFARLASLLFSPDLRVLDIETVEVRRPADGHVQGQVNPRTTRRFDNCRGTLHHGQSAYGMACDMFLGDHPCLGRPDRWTHSETFLLRGDELKVESSEGTSEGTMCQLPE